MMNKGKDIFCPQLGIGGTSCSQGRKIVGPPRVCQPQHRLKRKFEKRIRRVQAAKPAQSIGAWEKAIRFQIQNVASPSELAKQVGQKSDVLPIAEHQLNAMTYRVKGSFVLGVRGEFDQP